VEFDEEIETRAEPVTAEELTTGLPALVAEIAVRW